MQLSTNSSEQALRDLQTVLLQIPNHLYSQSIAVMYSASIGQHVRHIIEFYLCLQEQLNGGRVDYDLRKRNLELERSPKAAVEAIELICDWLHHIKAHKDINLYLIVNYDCENAKNKEEVQSSLKRELIFNVEHCIHHSAIIKIALHLLAPSIILPAHFGVAPSTVRYQKHQDQPDAATNS